MAKKGKVISASMSFAGWNLKDWFLGNWSTIKEIAKVGAPLLVTIWLVNNPVMIGFLTILGKFLLDSGEYFFKTYTQQ